MTIEKGGTAYLTTREATALLGVSRTRLLELVKSGKLKQYEQEARKVPLYSKSEIDVLLMVKERTEEARSWVSASDAELL